MLGLGVVGGLAIVAATIGGLVSWIGALLNTSQLESKTWFLVLLLLGIFSFGLFAMIAYVIAGPDGTRPRTGDRADARLKRTHLVRDGWERGLEPIGSPGRTPTTQVDKKPAWLQRPDDRQDRLDHRRHRRASARRPRSASPRWVLGWGSPAATWGGRSARRPRSAASR